MGGVLWCEVGAPPLKLSEKSLRMVVSNRNFLDFQGFSHFQGRFAVTFREGGVFIYFNWQLFLCQESEGEIYFLIFFPLYVSFVCCDVQGHGRLSEGKAGFVGSPLRSCHGSNPRGGCRHRGEATTGFFGNPGAEPLIWRFFGFSTCGVWKDLFFWSLRKLPKKDAVFSSILFFAMWNCTAVNGGFMPWFFLCHIQRLFGAVKDVWREWGVTQMIKRMPNFFGEHVFFWVAQLCRSWSRVISTALAPDPRYLCFVFDFRDFPCAFLFH